MFTTVAKVGRKEREREREMRDEAEEMPATLVSSHLIYTSSSQEFVSLEREESYQRSEVTGAFFFLTLFNWTLFLCLPLHHHSTIRVIIAQSAGEDSKMSVL